MKFATHALGVLLATAWLNFALGGVALGGTNLAAGKKYTLDPAPNYAGCTDPGDATQLTDGQYVSGRFWSQKGTVGWQNKSPVSITIDLEKSQPIGGLSFNTAAGTAGVDWPISILILVSDDGKVWNYAGDLVALSSKNSTLPRSGYAVHRFEAAGLSIHGRFVKLMVAPSGGYTFADEIEIYPSSWSGCPHWTFPTGHYECQRPLPSTPHGKLPPTAIANDLLSGSRRIGIC